jgi:hypothetical protein
MVPAIAEDIALHMYDGRMGCILWSVASSKAILNDIAIRHHHIPLDGHSWRSVSKSLMHYLES